MSEKELNEYTYKILFILTDMTKDQRAEYRREVADQMPEALPFVDAAINCAETYQGNGRISEIMERA